MSARSSVSEEALGLPPSNTQWFMDEVWPHHVALRAYLRARFPTLADIDNIIQEAYARVLRAHGSDHIRSPRALLFATARNAALDQLRHDRVVSIESVANIEGLSVSENKQDAFETLSREQELQLLEMAVRTLPLRCQQILIMRKIDGCSYAEIGRKLGIKHNTISAQITLGVLRCRRFLKERGVLGRQCHE